MKRRKQITAKFGFFPWLQISSGCLLYDTKTGEIYRVICKSADGRVKARLVTSKKVIKEQTIKAKRFLK